MKILAIDPATKTGWALSDSLDSRVYGTWDLKTRADESWGMKLVRFKGKLHEMIGNNAKPDIVVYERPGGQHTKAIITQSKIIGVLEIFCKEQGIEYRAYSSQEIKKHATGKGNSGKPLMISTAKEKFEISDVEPFDDNMADALWLLDLAQKEYHHVGV